MKKWKESFNDEGFPYIKFLNVPMRESKYGPIIDLAPEIMEIAMATAIISNNVPIKGKEVRFLRKVVALSLEKFAGKIGLTSGTVLRWEQAEKDQLDPVNEVAVRCIVAEILDIDLRAHFSQLVGAKTHEITVRVS